MAYRNQETRTTDRRRVFPQTTHIRPPRGGDWWGPWQSTTALAHALSWRWNDKDSMRILRRLIPCIEDLYGGDLVAEMSSLYYSEICAEVSDELENLLGPHFSPRLVFPITIEICHLLLRRMLVTLRLKTRSSGAAEGDGEEDELCGICLDCIDGGGDVATLDCRHEYHVLCITKWLLHGRKNVCPICRRKALHVDEDGFFTFIVVNSA